MPFLYQSALFIPLSFSSFPSQPVCSCPFTNCYWNRLSLISINLYRIYPPCSLSISSFSNSPLCSFGKMRLISTVSRLWTKTLLVRDSVRLLRPDLYCFSLISTCIEYWLKVIDANPRHVFSARASLLHAPLTSISLPPTV